ncbi:transposase [Thalassobacillus sp. CUG 92003]|uniref:transposase n=1 Tax=Thalassobacillus sp. CUG 92003 TaxID=2736641 RepID=UPI0015E7383C|nr:transposase [Thalassobacillus sp. CUG 92003]
MGRSYDKEFKDHVAKLVVDEGRKASEVSREMDVPYKTMNRWVRECRKEKEAKAEQLEYITPGEHKKREKELLDRIKELEEENEIVKKAAHIFMNQKK